MMDDPQQPSLRLNEGDVVSFSFPFAGSPADSRWQIIGGHFVLLEAAQGPSPKDS